MRRVVTPPTDIAARDRPDGSIQATARISAGTELVETDRLGDWSHVITPDGRELWIDARRLVTAETGRIEESIPQVSTRRSQRWLLAIVVIVAVTGASALLFVARYSGDSHSTAISDPPTIIKGWVDLEFEPVAVQPFSLWSYFSYVLGEDQILGFRPPSISTKPADVDFLQGFASDVTTELDPKAIAVPFALSHLVVLDGSDQLVALADSSLRKRDLFAGVIARRPIDDEVADFIVVPGNAVEPFVVLFGTKAVLTDRMLIYDAMSLEFRNEFPLPQPIDITAVGTSTGRLYVGHSSGLLVFSTWDMPDSPAELILSLEFPAAAFAVGFTKIGDPITLALDVEGESILVLDNRAGIKVDPIANIDLVAVTGETRTYTRSLAAVGQYAYVITTQGDLFVIDASPKDTISPQDRLISIVEDLGSSSDEPRLIGLDTSWGDPNRGVLVSDPERQRIWWISSGVDDGRNVEIPLMMAEP